MNDAGMSRRGLVIAGLFGLAGCLNLPGIRRADTVEILSPQIRLPEGLPKVGWQLAVALPTTPTQLAGSGIALSRSPFSIEYFDGVAWAEDLPDMLQEQIVAAFTRSGRITGVGADSADFIPDFLLETELSLFQAAYRPKSASPDISLRMTARLFAMPARRAVAVDTLHESVRAASRGIEDVMAAFNEASGRLLSQLVFFTLTAPQRANAG